MSHANNCFTIVSGKGCALLSYTGYGHCSSSFYLTSRHNFRDWPVSFVVCRCIEPLSIVTFHRESIISLTYFMWKLAERFEVDPCTSVPQVLICIIKFLSVRGIDCKCLWTKRRPRNDSSSRCFYEHTSCNCTGWPRLARSCRNVMARRQWSSLCAWKSFKR